MVSELSSVYHVKHRPDRMVVVVCGVTDLCVVFLILGVFFVPRVGYRCFDIFIRIIVYFMALMWGFY